LTKHHAFEVTLQGVEFAAVIIGHVGWRDARNFGHDVFDFGFADGFFALGRWQYALGGTCFVYDINGFVRQMPVIDVFGAEL
jgi:hypothetical protein